MAGEESRFLCPNCGAVYELVRVEAETVTADRELTCLACGGPLQGREGRFALKYFLLGRPHSVKPRRAVRPRAEPTPTPTH
jgi:predicted RNA-binding Zn-ribbon protein involved in translation (DUF1610 family)